MNAETFASGVLAKGARATKTTSETTPTARARRARHARADTRLPASERSSGETPMRLLRPGLRVHFRLVNPAQHDRGLDRHLGLVARHPRPRDLGPIAVGGDRYDAAEGLGGAVELAQGHELAATEGIVRTFHGLILPAHGCCNRSASDAGICENFPLPAARNVAERQMSGFGTRFAP